jgi:hypothetical protein
MFVYHRRRGWPSSLHQLRTICRRRVTHVRSNILVADLTIGGCSTSHGSHSDRVRVHQFSIQGTRVRTLLHYETQHVAISAISGLLANDLASFTSGEADQILSRPARDVYRTIACNVSSCATMASSDPIPHVPSRSAVSNTFVLVRWSVVTVNVRLTCVERDHHALLKSPWPRP